MVLKSQLRGSGASKIVSSEHLGKVLLLAVDSSSTIIILKKQKFEKVENCGVTMMMEFWKMKSPYATNHTHNHAISIILTYSYLQYLS